MKQKQDKCCEHFESDLQKLMLELTDRLAAVGNDSCTIVSIMGPPDATEIPSRYGNLTSEGESTMVYWWRHWRDFLYFVTEDGKIKNVKWFYAYE